MAYPGAQLPSSFFYLDAATEATAPSNKKFVAFTCVEAGTFTFKAPESSASLFDINGAAVGASGVDIPLEAGMTVYGTFSSITPDAFGKGLAYVG